MEQLQHLVDACLFSSDGATVFRPGSSSLWITDKTGEHADIDKLRLIKLPVSFKMQRVWTTVVRFCERVYRSWDIHNTCSVESDTSFRWEQEG